MDRWLRMSLFFLLMSTSLGYNVDEDIADQLKEEGYVVSDYPDYEPETQVAPTEDDVSDYDMDTSESDVDGFTEKSDLEEEASMANEEFVPMQDDNDDEEAIEDSYKQTDDKLPTSESVEDGFEGYISELESEADMESESSVNEEVVSNPEPTDQVESTFASVEDGFQDYIADLDSESKNLDAETEESLRGNGEDESSEVDESEPLDTETSEGEEYLTVTGEVVQDDTQGTSGDDSGEDESSEVEESEPLDTETGEDEKDLYLMVTGEVVQDDTQGISGDDSDDLFSTSESVQEEFEEYIDNLEEKSEMQDDALNSELGEYEASTNSTVLLPEDRIEEDSEQEDLEDEPIDDELLEELEELTDIPNEKELVDAYVEDDIGSLDEFDVQEEDDSEDTYSETPMDTDTQSVTDSYQSGYQVEDHQDSYDRESIQYVSYKPKESEEDSINTEVDMEDTSAKYNDLALSSYIPSGYGHESNTDAPVYPNGFFEEHEVDEIEEVEVDIPGHVDQGQFYSTEYKIFLEEEKNFGDEGLPSYHTIAYFILIVIVSLVAYIGYTNKHRLFRSRKSNYSYSRLGEQQFTPLV